MTNDIMTNDQNGCADDGRFENLKIRRFEDGEGCADAPMTNDITTNDQLKAAPA